MLNSSSVPLHFFLLVKDANHMNVLSYLVSTYFGSTQMPKIDDDVPSKLYFYVQKENSAEFDGSLTLGTVLKKGESLIPKCARWIIYFQVLCWSHITYHIQTAKTEIMKS